MPDKPQAKEHWSSGSAYEAYVGRWSLLVAREFLAWLSPPSGGRWLDVGCGTGALSQTVLDVASPRELVGVDPSDAFVAFAREHLADPRARFVTGDAQALPEPDEAFDAAVSGLVLNFVPEPARMVAEMSRVTRRGGAVGVYVWDYAGEMQMIRHFWDAAAELDPDVANLDQGERFPICHPDRLASLFEDASLQAIETRSIDVTTTFRDFDDYWTPFLGGQGPAPGYAVSLTEEGRAALRERLRARLPVSPDGSIRLIARANAVRGIR